MAKRVAVVTGGLGGLGVEICRYLARSGHQVVSADLESHPERIEQFLKEVAEHADSVRFEAVNVGDYDSCTQLIQRVRDAYGSIDVLVNAAGITRDGTLRKMNLPQWHDVINVNLNGVFNMCRQVVDSMCDRGYGRIVNISSVNGQTGQFGQTNYAASKAGMHGFTMAMAREVARKGVTVNSVSPGYCRTRLVMTIPENVRNDIIAHIPVGRIGEPSEIARVVDFLAAEESGFITGANIPVNGGYFMDF